jgi:hypothetical protein
MVYLREFIFPNKFKIVLFIMLFIPSITLIMILLGSNNLYYSFRYFSPSFITNNLLLFIISIFTLLLLGLILSYVFGCFIDYFIQNEKVKITIAIISGMVSLLIIYAFYKMVTEPIICDPVHIPTNNQTICDPVHQPSQSQNYSANSLNELTIDKSMVKNSLEECLSNLEN